MSSTRRLGRTLAWTVSGVLGLGLVAGAAAGIAEARSARQADATQALPAAVMDQSGQQAGPHGRLGRLGRLGGRVVHGEFVVKTKDGYQTVAVQRGTVTSRDGNTVVVTSPDGSTPETWTLTADTKVRKDRAKGSLDDIAAGSHVMLIGPKSGDTRTARLVVVRTGAPADRAAPPATGDTGA